MDELKSGQERPVVAVPATSRPTRRQQPRDSLLLLGRSCAGAGPACFVSQGTCQGNRVLTEQDFKEVIVSPAGLQAFALDAHFQAGLLFQLVVRYLPQRRLFCGLWSLRIRL